MSESVPTGNYVPREPESDWEKERAHLVRLLERDGKTFSAMHLGFVGEEGFKALGIACARFGDVTCVLDSRLDDHELGMALSKFADREGEFLDKYVTRFRDRLKETF